MDAIIQSRINDLEDNIQKDRELLKAYEDKERYESDPRKLARIRSEIERQRTSMARYRQEYQELVKEVDNAPLETRKEAADDLKRIFYALTEIQSGQKVILDELSETRKTVLERLDTSEQAVIASIIKELDQNQLETVRCIWDALETNRIPEKEVKSTLDSLRELILDIEQNRVADPHLLKKADEISKVLDNPTLDLNHKLKLTIPLIPTILSYESEIDLKSAWQSLKAKFKKYQ